MEVTNEKQTAGVHAHGNLLFQWRLLFWGRLAVGVIFIGASIDKILHPAAFARIIYNYQILPDEFINVTAIVLPWIEIVLGCLLVLGLWLPGAVLLANLLLLAFFASLLFNLARGLDVHCGCFSTNIQGDPQTTWYLIRDAGFLLLGGYLFFAVFMRCPREENGIEQQSSTSEARTQPQSKDED